MPAQSKLNNLTFKIGTKNIRGFLHTQKMSKFFERVKQFLNIDILCLQETNIGPSRQDGHQVKDIRAIWSRIDNGDNNTDDSQGFFASTSADGKQSTITAFSSEFQTKCKIHNTEVIRELDGR